MGMVSTVILGSVVLAAAAYLCRRAGSTRQRNESVVATETYRIGGRDSYTLEFRYNVSTGIYNIFALDYPSSGEERPNRLSRRGQIISKTEPRTMDEATRVGRLWMTEYSAALHTDTDYKPELSGPAMFRRATSRKTKPTRNTARRHRAES